MTSKLIGAAVTAALLGFATTTWAQSSSSSSPSASKAAGSSSTSGMSSSKGSTASSGASATATKCADMKGAEREKCMQAEKRSPSGTSTTPSKSK